MHLRVIDRTGSAPGFGRSLLRLVGLGLAILLLFTGFLPVLVDDRRRALQDFLAGTVVVYDDGAPFFPGESAVEDAPPDDPLLAEGTPELPAPRD